MQMRCADFPILWSVEVVVGCIGCRDVPTSDHVGKFVGFAVDW